MVNVAEPESMVGVYVEVTTPLVSVVAEKVPLVAVHDAVVALPVSVPETIIVPFEQTDCVV